MHFQHNTTFFFFIINRSLSTTAAPYQSPSASSATTTTTTTTTSSSLSFTKTRSLREKLRDSSRTWGQARISQDSPEAGNRLARLFSLRRTTTAATATATDSPSCQSEQQQQQQSMPRLAEEEESMLLSNSNSNSSSSPSSLIMSSLKSPTQHPATRGNPPAPSLPTLPSPGTSFQIIGTKVVG